MIKNYIYDSIIQQVMQTLEKAASWQCTFDDIGKEKIESLSGSTKERYNQRFVPAEVPKDVPFK